jgi:hypothetical protein
MPDSIDPQKLIDFHKKLATFFETEETSLQDSAKLVALVRLALEIGTRDLGLAELNYLLARVQYTSLGIQLGKDVSFGGIVEEFANAGEKRKTRTH